MYFHSLTRLLQTPVNISILCQAHTATTGICCYFHSFSHSLRWHLLLLLWQTHLATANMCYYFHGRLTQPQQTAVSSLMTDSNIHCKHLLLFSKKYHTATANICCYFQSSLTQPLHTSVSTFMADSQSHCRQLLLLSWQIHKVHEDYSILFSRQTQTWTADICYYLKRGRLTQPLQSSNGTLNHICCYFHGSFTQSMFENFCYMYFHGRLTQLLQSAIVTFITYSASHSRHMLVTIQLCFMLYRKNT